MYMSRDNFGNDATPMKHLSKFWMWWPQEVIRSTSKSMICLAERSKAGGYLRMKPAGISPAIWK